MRQELEAYVVVRPAGYPNINYTSDMMNALEWRYLDTLIWNASLNRYEYIKTKVCRV